MVNVGMLEADLSDLRSITEKQFEAKSLMIESRNNSAYRSKGLI